MTGKSTAQQFKEDGSSAAPARSSPGWFIFDKVEAPGPVKGPSGPGLDDNWGKVFSEPQPGNAVHFFTTGASYFEDVSKAMESACSTIFITGWQVNFDVDLVPGKTLFTCLKTAVDKGVHVYVMPWLSPKAGQDCHDFETILALAQLNAGNAASPRMHLMPATAQSDQAGSLNIAFAHHQKLVVIDNKQAYVGGMDLAYGRRDDARFSLKAEGRTGNEFYSPCVPAIHDLSHIENTAYLTLAELISACYEGKVARVAQFATSAPFQAVAKSMDTVSSVKDWVKDRTAELRDRCNTSDVIPQYLRSVQDAVQRGEADLARWAWAKLDAATQNKLDQLRKTGGAQAADAATAVLAWLNNATLDRLDPRLQKNVAELVETLVISLFNELTESAAKRREIYPNLLKLGKMLPGGGATADPEVQPRMPWHDVQCRVTGSAVYDLSMNFVRRWNGLAKRYESSVHAITEPALTSLFMSLGMKLNKPPIIARVQEAHAPRRSTEKPARCWVQVLRSAPLNLCRDECAAAGEPVPTMAQNNCKKAMLTAIAGAQKFIYIEGQFFQANFGEDLPSILTREKRSGPMQTVLDIRRSPQYKKYAAMLGIEGVAARDIPRYLRWEKVDDVQRDLKGGGKAFWADLDEVLKNLATAEASRVLGPAQAEVVNPMALALGGRIERAVMDGSPFHVYMVLPVHPEGTLNTLNIMSQLHLTMQSLVGGKNSLLNLVRRAIWMKDQIKSRKITLPAAREAVAEVSVQKVAEDVGERWRDHLTLLNLRNWDNIGGVPVTEQVYVHSKLLIADDRVAILGSANINDRSQMGDRDSEIAVIVRDDAPSHVKLDGQHDEPVSAAVHQLRVDLWKKLFGLTGGKSPANELEAVVDKPAEPATWKAIQKVANSNSLEYSNAFKFLPGTLEKASDTEFKPGAPVSIWPTWQGDRMQYRMPFNKGFWQELGPRDEQFSWDAASKARQSFPSGVKGFIVEMPIHWAYGENNISGMNLTVIADVESPRNAADAKGLASAEPANDGRAKTV